MPDRLRNCYMCGVECYGRRCRACFESGTKGNHANKKRKTRMRREERW